MQSPPVGGRLRLFVSAWESIHPDSWVLRTVSQGYRIEFTSRPPLTGKMRVTPVPQSPDQREALEEEIHGLLEKGVIYPVPPHLARDLYRSSFFVTPKKPDKWRPILNLKPLNKMFIRPKRFRMETLSSIIPSLEAGMWATTVDLKDAYLHIPIHQADQKFLAFRYRGTDYAYNALPFGLSTAPRVFTRVTRSILAHLRRKGILLFAYLDDWLLLGRSEEESREVTSTVLALLRELGWLINLDKSALVPSQDVAYLGARLDLRSGQAFPTDKRFQDLKQTCQFVMSKRLLKARDWLKLLGLMASLVDVLPVCRLRMRPIQIHVLKHFKPSEHHLTTKVPCTQEVVRAIAWWTEESNVLQGRPFVDERPQTSISTDASLQGWGAVWEHRSTAGPWSQVESSAHINVLELWAVDRAVQKWSQGLRGKAITVFSDNSTTVAYINRQGGTRSETLYKATRDLLLRCQHLDISIRAAHLAGTDNVMADALSRGTFNANEWSLSTIWADHAFEVFGRPQVDLFASSLNAKLPTFCTRFHHPQAWATDALSFPWDRMFLYAFPPWCLIHKVLLKLYQSTNTELLLVAPTWPNRPWFPLLLSLLIDFPLRLPDHDRILTQRRGTIWHQDTESLHLAVWKLSPSVSKRRAFLQQLSSWPPVQGENPQPLLTIRDWRSSGTGPRPTLVIPWMPR